MSASGADIAGVALVRSIHGSIARPIGSHHPSFDAIGAVSVRVSVTLSLCGVRSGDRVSVAAAYSRNQKNRNKI